MDDNNIERVGDDNWNKRELILKGLGICPFCLVNDANYHHWGNISG